MTRLDDKTRSKIASSVCKQCGFKRMSKRKKRLSPPPEWYARASLAVKQKISNYRKTHSCSFDAARERLLAAAGLDWDSFCSREEARDSKHKNRCDKRIVNQATGRTARDSGPITLQDVGRHTVVKELQGGAPGLKQTKR